MNGDSTKQMRLEAGVRLSALPIQPHALVVLDAPEWAELALYKAEWRKLLQRIAL
jgi:hypothetical protein